MNRKEFLKRCTALTAGVACLDLTLVGCASLQFAEFAMQDNRAVVRKSLFEDRGFVLLDVSSLPAPVYVRQLEGDDFVAVVLKCTHRGCTVRAGEETLDCPCHGSRYTTTGVVIEGPASRNLRVLSAVSGTDDVTVTLS